MQVKGFSAAAVEAGIRYKDRLDLGLIYSEIPAVAAGVFTTNRVKAAPVELSSIRLRQGRAQAILVNSGNANACSGKQGMEMAVATSALAAKALHIPEELVQVASTGVIGQQLDLACFERAIPGLADKLAADGFDDLSKAIMTTDTVPKLSFKTVMIEGTQVNILGMAKGAGMIMPNMATMLGFILTDARIVFPALRGILRKSVNQSFNRITIDGDTSTNDTLLILANGAAENPWIDDENPGGYKILEEAVIEICKELALKIVADGEGATKLATIRVIGARDKEDAEKGARTIATSSLVKTAFFGEDANWGRILAALGQSGCRFQQDRVDLFFDDVKLLENGAYLGADAEKQATEVMRQDKFTVTVELKNGSEEVEIHTSDLSLDYVKINADYRS